LCIFVCFKVELIRLVVGAKIFAVIGKSRGNRGAYHARILLFGCMYEHERRNCSKIRFYGEIFDEMGRRCGNLKGGLAINCESNPFVFAQIKWNNSGAL
jgi:hypothetical protein